MEAFPRKSYKKYCNQSYINVHTLSKKFNAETKITDLVNRLYDVDFNKENWLVNEMQNILGTNTNLNRVE